MSKTNVNFINSLNDANFVSKDGEKIIHIWNITREPAYGWKHQGMILLNKYFDILRPDGYKVYLDGEELKQDKERKLDVDIKVIANSNFNIEVEINGERETYKYKKDFKFSKPDRDTCFCETHQRREKMSDQRPEGMDCWEGDSVFWPYGYEEEFKNTKIPELLIKTLERLVNKKLDREKFIDELNKFNKKHIYKKYIELIYRCDGSWLIKHVTKNNVETYLKFYDYKDYNPNFYVYYKGEEIISDSFINKFSRYKNKLMKYDFLKVLYDLMLDYPYKEYFTIDEYGEYNYKGN